MEKEKELEHMKRKFGKVETTTVTVTLPMNFFLEWDTDCRQKFNDVRYVKMMSDHVKAKILDMLLDGDLNSKVIELKKIMKGEY